MNEGNTPPPPQEEEKKEEEGQKLPEVLKDFPGAPSSDQIEQWKAEFGEVYVSGFSETELFVWRPLTRPEHINIQVLAQDPERQLDQFKLEEMVCDTCVLYKSVSRSWDKGKAGTATTLSEQIMSNSNFLTPYLASQLVAKL